MSAINPAHSGATALVPPITPDCPSTSVSYPVVGSASPATSGTPRPTFPPALADGGTPALLWYVGRGNTSLTPPPVAPSLLANSFHTVSLAMLLPVACNFVPPHASTFGLDAGKST